MLPPSVPTTVIRPTSTRLLAPHIIPLEPPIQHIMEVIQVRRDTIRPPLPRARILLRQAPSAIQPGPITGREPPVIQAQRVDNVAPGAVQGHAQNVRAAVRVLHDGALAVLLAVLAITRVALEQARSRAGRVGVAGGFVKGEKGQDRRVDAVLHARDLEEAVVLLAGTPDALVEGFQGNVRNVPDV